MGLPGGPVLRILTIAGPPESDGVGKMGAGPPEVSTSSTLKKDMVGR